MVRVFRAFVTLAAAGALAGVGALVAPTATATVSTGETATYIVVLEPGSLSARAESASLARQYGGRVGFVYEHALRGFSITASPAAAVALARNPRVSYVEADQPVTIDAQTTPTGIGRIFAADSNPATPEAGYNPNLKINGLDDFRVDVDVAVIDTGIDLNNPDLNVAGGISCLNVSSVSSCTGTGDDDHYHGTHVAGTIAALDNGIGVVGVAPGARLWAVKVLDSTGSGSDAGVIAGIDWVLDHNTSTTDATGDIEVANLSLGGPQSDSENQAVDNAVAQGVTMVVAAGNSSADAGNYSPASAGSALTVSALADYDGLPGGRYSGAKCYQDTDDTLANFSNYGTVVDLIAPGACITSTNNNSTSLRTISGTSMASPHVAGAAALLRSMGKDVPTTESDLKTSGNGGWSGDVDTVPEPLLDVSDPVVFDPGWVASPSFTNMVVSGSGSPVSGGWTATVTITLAPSGTPINGAWNDNASPSSCITDGNGRCSFTRKVSKRVTSVTWTHLATGRGVTIRRP